MRSAPASLRPWRRPSASNTALSRRPNPAWRVALADRLDSLVGLFAAGLAPTGARDPFGLRRAAIGVVQPLIEHNLTFDLSAALKSAAALQPLPAADPVMAGVMDFLSGRLRVVLMEDGFKYDVVDAVLAAQSKDPAGAAGAVRQLSAWVDRQDWNTLLPAYARCVRIIRSQPADVSSMKVNEFLFEDPAERALYAALQSLETNHPMSVDELMTVVEKLLPSINTFFDKVLVMADDPAVRANRLALVQRVAALADGIADLGKLEGF